MNMEYYLPTKIIIGKGCIAEKSALLNNIGSKALIVTGRRSAKINGSQQDIEEALQANNIPYYIFDAIEPNPSIKTVREAAGVARRERVDFIIGCGGGSPLDAAKAIAILAVNEVDDTELFSGQYPNTPLPVIAVPTTAGTGSEVTQYSILTDDNIQSKRSITSAAIFPKIAFLDAIYTEGLPTEVTINTAIDALSHAMEGYLSNRANDISSIYAIKSMQIIGSCLELLDKEMNFATREKLLYASVLGGVVIAQTGTTALHSMGYSLTYFKQVDHGRANGLLMYEYLKLINREGSDKVREVLNLLGLEDIEALKLVLATLLKQSEPITVQEVKLFSEIAAKAKNIGNTLVIPSIADIESIFSRSLGVSPRLKAFKL